MGSERERIAKLCYIATCVETPEQVPLAASAWERVKDDDTYPYVRKMYALAEAILADRGERFCGCCGRINRTDSDDWCDVCDGHVIAREAMLPHDRTWFAQYGMPCPNEAIPRV